MAISMGRAKVGGQPYSRERLASGDGRYVCRVIRIREESTRTYGLGFFLDFEVVTPAPFAGASEAGSRGSICYFPEDARGGGGLSKEQAYELENGKIQVAVAACLGLSREEAQKVNDDRYQAAVGPKQPLTGNLFELACVPHVNKQGKKSSFYEMYPHGEGAKPTSEAAKVTPKLPPKKVEAKFPPEGWDYHPEDRNYVFNEKTEECIEVAELKARLAA